MTMLHPPLRRVAPALLLAWAVAAQAQSSNVADTTSAAANTAAPAAADTTATAGALSLWELGMGAGVMRLPHYRGSNQSRAWLLPLPYVVYRGDIVKADREGARAELIKANDWRFDFSIAAGAPTNSEDDRTRQGMRDLAPTLEFGPRFVWTMAKGDDWRLETRVPLRGAMTLERRPRVIGGVMSPNLNFDVIVGGWDVGVFVGPVFGSRSQHGYYYDVAAADAQAGRPAYRAGAGYAGSQLVFGTSKRFGDLWFGAFGKVDHLQGAVFDDSPIVRRKTNVSFGIGALWVFWKSQRPVQDSTVR